MNALAFALWSIVGPIAGPADSDAAAPIVAVTAVQLEGEGSPAELEALTDRVRATLQSDRYDILEIIEPCARDQACWRAAAARGDATVLVELQLVESESDRTFSISVVNMESGDALTVAEGTCELCGRGELLDLASDLGGKARRVLDRRFDVGTLELTSSPPGATVVVDGTALGRTPLQASFSPGAHEMRVTLDGHHTVVRAIDIVAGTREAMRVALAPLPTNAPANGPPAAAADRRRAGAPMIATGSGLLAGGVAAVVAGAVLVALHARPIRSACSGPDIDPDGDCRFLHDTRTGGFAAIGVGAVGIVAGAVVLGLGLKRRSAAAPDSARATLRPRLGRGLAIEF